MQAVTWTGNITRSFVQRGDREGSEPARFAFADSQILFSKLAGFEADIRKAADIERKTSGNVSNVLRSIRSLALVLR